MVGRMTSFEEADDSKVQQRIRIRGKKDVVDKVFRLGLIERRPFEDASCPDVGEKLR